MFFGARNASKKVRLILCQRRSTRLNMQIHYTVIECCRRSQAVKFRTYQFHYLFLSLLVAYLTLPHKINTLYAAAASPLNRKDEPGFQLKKATIVALLDSDKRSSLTQVLLYQQRIIGHFESIKCRLYCYKFVIMSFASAPTVVVLSSHAEQST
jgi:hypothetical protein